MIDLHTHTIYSDGSLSVKELIDNAIDNDVKIVSITDHDTIEGLSEYKNNCLRGNILVVPGVEFSTDTYYLDKKTKIHLLGYGYDVDNFLVTKVLDNLYHRRYNDNKEYVEKLINKYSYLSNEYFLDFDYGKYGWLYKKILSHISNYLSEEKYRELREFLVSNKPIYNKYNESVEDMIYLMHSCNGYAVLAHPQEYCLSKLELNELVKYLSDIGLDGIETYHINSNSEDRKYYHELANKYSLYETGGSDFHNFQYGNSVGNPNINFPKDYEPLLVKRLIKEKKVLGDIDA